jgi:hypothetical protein
MNKAKNTKQRGLARIFIFPAGGKFTAVCLDLDIIEEADTKGEALEQIKEAVSGYMVNAVKNGLDDGILNRPAPKKYWDLYKLYLKFISAENGKLAPTSSKFRDSCFYSFPMDSYSENSNLCFV